MKSRWKYALYGIAAGVLLWIVSLFVPFVHIFFFRTITPHLFNFGAFVWSSTQGFIAPLVAASIINFLLIFVPLGSIGYFCGGLIESKRRNAALVAAILCLALWILIFHLLGQPMAMGHH
jgi:ABC-type uncharacterized transport system permease subunit